MRSSHSVFFALLLAMGGSRFENYCLRDALINTQNPIHLNVQRKQKCDNTASKWKCAWVLTTARPILLVTTAAAGSTGSTYLSTVFEANSPGPSRLGAIRLKLVGMIRVDSSPECNRHLSLNNDFSITEILMLGTLVTALNSLDVGIEGEIGCLAVKHNVESWVWVRNI